MIQVHLGGKRKSPFYNICLCEFNFCRLYLAFSKPLCFLSPKFWLLNMYLFLCNMCIPENTCAQMEFLQIKSYCIWPRESLLLKTYVILFEVKASQSISQSCKFIFSMPGVFKVVPVLFHLNSHPPNNTWTISSDGHVPKLQWTPLRPKRHIPEASNIHDLSRS